MKIKIISTAIIVLSLSFLCSFTYGYSKNENIYLHNADKINTDTQKSAEAYNGFSEEARDELSGIYDSFISALPDGVPKSAEEISGFIGIGEVFSWLVEALSSKDNVKTLLLFVSMGIFFALVQLFISEHSGATDITTSATAVILSYPVLVYMKELVFESADTISRCSELFSGMIPPLTALLAIGSGGAAASVSGVGLGISLGFVSGVLAKLLLPLSAMIFSISMLSAFDTDGVTSGAAKGIRGIFNYLIGFSSLIIAGVVGIQTVIAVSADNLALKSAKYTVSGMIPIVGSTVSGALSALIAGVKLLSVNIGTVSVIAIISIVCVPLVKLLFLRFCLSLAINVSSLSGGGFGEKLFSSLRSALDTVTAVFVSSVLIYLIEIIVITSSIRGAL